MSETQELPRRSIGLPGEVIALLHKMAQEDERSLSKQMSFMVKQEAVKRGISIESA